MWAHVESADYSKAAAGVAVSDSPTGPFKYLGSFRPNNAMSRDQTLFVDDDGRAYQLYSSENNATLYISELTDDYLRPSGRFTAAKLLPFSSTTENTTCFHRAAPDGTPIKPNLLLPTP